RPRSRGLFPRRALCDARQRPVAGHRGHDGRRVFGPDRRQPVGEGSHVRGRLPALAPRRPRRAPGGGGPRPWRAAAWPASGPAAGGALLSGGYWRSDDENPAFSRLHSSGWSLSPQIAVDSNTTAGIEARGTSFDATGASGAFGNAERMVGVVVDSRLGSLYLSGATSIGRAARTAATPSG